MQKKSCSKQKNAEEKRLEENKGDFIPPWYKWGPYVSERSWGSVREDYSREGKAWESFPFSDAHKRAYRWGEDGIAGICDRYQILVLAPAFWNTKDPLLKERLFGLSSEEGNHGEDVKEIYYHLDNVPTHSYMKYLYRYPQQEFPYKQLIENNKNRSLQEKEFELIDTGIFNQNAYFDIFIEYAKENPDEIVIKVEAINRSSHEAPLHLLMQLFFRNQWSWSDEKKQEPRISKGEAEEDFVSLVVDERMMPPLDNLPFSYRLGKYYLYGPKGGEILFTNNDTKQEGKQGFYRDAFHEYLIHKKKAISPFGYGTKAALHYSFETVSAGKSVTLFFKLTPKVLKSPFAHAQKVIDLRKKEADEFYENLHPKTASIEEKKIQRQAFAGLLWNKQIYLFDVKKWIEGDSKRSPPPKGREQIRNVHWKHLNSMRVLLVPDKWEYPWFASWDHAFHAITMSLIDIEFAKEQLWLLLFDQFQHPNGQIPAYEWEFSDLNPPVHAWAALYIYRQEQKKYGRADRSFLEKCYHKLLINFSWWVNRVDSSGKNVFEGGFLGLDNIALFDRSVKLPAGMRLQQSDGTAWMALFCLSLMQIALELAKEDRAYESLATKFFEHYIYIVAAMQKRQNVDYELWSERDGFFYDVISFDNGFFEKIRIRSIVGLIPLFCVEILDEKSLKAFPEFHSNFHWFLKNRVANSEKAVVQLNEEGNRLYILSPFSPYQLKRVMKYVTSKEEFFSSFGLRSLSKVYEKNPYQYANRVIQYEPGESLARVKGGNSNWRGPIWMPVNFLLIEALHKLGSAYDEVLKLEENASHLFTLSDVAKHLFENLLFLFKEKEHRFPRYLGDDFPYKDDPNWTEYLLFYEYFNPETGKGLGASHQTGWTALIANLIQKFR